MSQDDDDIQMPQRFMIEEEKTRLYRRFNAQGRQLTVRLLPPPEKGNSNPMSHFLDSVTELFEYALRDHEDSDMIGITISNEENVNDRAIGISFRRKNQITGDVIWTVFEKGAQSNARLNALDKLVVTVHSVRMLIGHGGDGIATKGRPLDIMVHLKRSIVRVKAENNCLAHALVIAKAKVDGDPNYKSYSNGYDTSCSRPFTRDNRHRPVGRRGISRANEIPRTFQGVQDRCFRRTEL